MKNRFLWMFLLILGVNSAAQANYAEHRHIVMLRNSKDVSGMAKASQSTALLPAISAYVAKFDDAEREILRRDRRVREVYEDVERHIYATPTTPIPTPWTGDKEPWGIAAIGADKVWPLSQGSPDIGVEEIDTGIDYFHPDLTGCYAGGYNWVGKNNNPRDDNGHGTHVAGTICAAQNNFGVVGVAPRTKIYAEKVLDAKGSGSGIDIVTALQDVLINTDVRHTRIVTMSLGSSSPYDPEQNIIEELINHGVLVVVAVGNLDTATNPSDTLDTPSYPAQYPGVLRVGAVDDKSVVASFSKHNTDVVAPGVNVLSDFMLGGGLLGSVKVPQGEPVDASPMDGSPNGTVTAILKNSGTGGPQEYPVTASPYIGLVARGNNLSFAQKEVYGLMAKVSAIIVYNNVPGSFRGTLGSATISNAVPTVSVSDTDGTRLKTFLEQPVTVGIEAADYEYLDGTSMATPHVTGIAALIWALVPNASAENVKQAIVATAHDLDQPTISEGHGMVDAYAAAKYLEATYNAPPRRRVAKP